MPSDPAFSRAGQQGATPPEPPVEEPRTETTLTTRISINIPGSRPIPPVVVRSPMPGADGDSAAEDQSGAAEAAAPTGPRHRSGSGSSPVIGVMDSANGTGTMPDLPPEWRTAGQGAPISPAATTAPPAEPTAPAGTAPAGDAESPSTWFVPRKKGQPGAAGPEPTPAPAPAPAPAVTPPYEQQPGYEQPGFGQPVYQQQPYGSPEPEPQYQPPQYQAPEYPQPEYQSPFQPQTPFQPQPPLQGQVPLQGQPPFQAQPTPPQPPAGPSRPAGGRPAGMNSGLIVGGADLPAAMDALDSTIPLAVVRDPSLPPAPPQAAAGAQAPARTAPRAPGSPAARPPVTPKPSPRGPAASGSPSAAPGQAPTGPSRPQAPAQPRAGDGFAGGTGGAGAPPRKESTETAQPSPGSAAGKAKGKGKAARGRKLVVTGGVLLVLLAGVTYGAGLMLNQGDVPKGTTVLGQNIGGDTRDAAVHALDGTVGVLAAKPLQLMVGGRPVQLQTSVAGLSIDTTATVQGVAHHSYNPADVVSSLFGGEHQVAPVVRIDLAKLRSALQTLAGGGAGGAREGSVSFTADGSVVTTLPQAGHALDVNTAVDLVRDAYQERAAGLPDHVITLPVTATEPKTTAAAVNAAAGSIGKWAAKNTFTIQIHGVTQPFGKKTFSKSLTLRPDATGKFVPVFDLAKLKDVYGSAFDQVQIKHNGVAGPVTPQDIATALTQLLSNPDGDKSVTLT